jgi:hypothetical protein
VLTGLTNAIHVSGHLDLVPAVFAEARRPRGYFEQVFWPSPTIGKHVSEYHEKAKLLTASLKNKSGNDADLRIHATELLARLDIN